MLVIEDDRSTEVIAKKIILVRYEIILMTIFLIRKRELCL
jgi:hypothetical protein